jgi:putative ubiquitin-RnfH superfamily antitoxin RatB of RatAB toxin-antitoxin module
MVHADTAPGGLLQIELVFCPRPGQIDLVSLSLPAGANVDGALRQSGLLQRHGLSPDGLNLGIWGRRCDGDTKLRDRDRVEIYRPLIVDPKEARRQRYKRQKDKPPSAAGA